MKKRYCVICGRKLRHGIKYCWRCKKGIRDDEQKPKKGGLLKKIILRLAEPVPLGRTRKTNKWRKLFDK